MKKSYIAVAFCLLLWSAQAQDAAESASDSVLEPTQDVSVPEAEEVVESAPTPVPTPAPTPVPPPPKKPSVLGVKDLSAVVYTADGKKDSSSKGKLGDSLFKSVTLNAGQSVEVTVNPTIDDEPAKPQQAMIMATSKSHPGLAAYAIAKIKKDGSHVVTLSTAAVEKQLGSLGGELELSLVLGDPSVKAGVSGALGSIVLPEAATGASPKPKLLTATNQPVNNFKHNIAHIFRTPDKRAPALVSLAFTGLALAPLSLLVVYLGTLGVNLKGLPSGAASLWVLLFHGSIAAMLLLFLLFWLELNLAQTLPLALGVGACMALTGYKALGALSAQRIMEGKASSAPMAVKKAN